MQNIYDQFDQQPQFPASIVTRPADPRLGPQLRQEENAANASEYDAALRVEQLERARVERQIREQQLNRERSAGVGATPGQQAVDRKFADRYVEWTTQGRSDVAKQLDQLETAMQTLGRYNVSGPLVGSTPDIINTVINPRAIETREAIEEVIQRNLRAVLGAQFTEREGERLIARGYNPRLSEQENSVRLGRLIQQIRTAAEANESAAQHFEQNGTLAGWQGKLYNSADDFDLDRPTPQDGDGRVARLNSQGQFGGAPRDGSGQMSPDQVRAYDAFLSSNPSATADQLAAFGEAMGFPILNAEQVIDDYRRTGRFTSAADTQYRNRQADEIKAYRDQMEGQAGVSDLFEQGARLGFQDEAAGIGGAIGNAISAPFTDQSFDPIGSYRANRDAERMRLDEAREHTGWMGTGAEIIGGFASGRMPLTTIAGRPAPQWAQAPRSIGGRIRQGAGIGAGTGAVAGFGYGEGIEGSLTGAGIGATVGAGIGGGLPALGGAGNRLIEAGRTVTGTNPNAARDVIGRAIRDDNNTPRTVAEWMEANRANGVPSMLADSGDNVRGLLAASARSPGPGRTIAREALRERQDGLADRVTGAIQRDLGPTSNPHQIREEAMAQARQRAAPLYESFNSRPGAGAFASQVQDLLNRPSVRNALGRAQRIAAEEGRDPMALGFDFNEAGDVILGQSPSWQTLDYIKRGLDDVVETYRDKTTGRLNLDTEGSSINDTLRTLVRRMDEANPDYAAARSAWAGPTRAIAAMDKGLRAFNMTGDDIANVAGNMSPGEREFFQLGLRRSMAEQVASRGDHADIPHALIGTGKKRGALASAFDDAPNFGRFTDTLNAEQAGFQTYRTAMQGSPTAPNLQDDAALANSVTTGIADLATTGLPVMSGLRQAVNFGTSRAGDQTKQQVASLLSETNPQTLSELARELSRQEAMRRASLISAGRRAGQYGRAGGFLGGMFANQGY